MSDFQGCTKETNVGGTESSDAHARLDANECGKTRALPFFTKELIDQLDGVDCVRVEHVIDGDNKGNKGVVMLPTFCWPLFLFGVFRGCWECAKRCNVHTSQCTTGWRGS